MTPPPLAYTVYALENIDYYHEPNLTWTKCYPVSLPRGGGGLSFPEALPEPMFFV